VLIARDDAEFPERASRYLSGESVADFLAGLEDFQLERLQRGASARLLFKVRESAVSARLTPTHLFPAKFYEAGNCTREDVLLTLAGHVRLVNGV